MAVPVEVGTTIAETRSFTQAEVDRFAALSGDDNPIHVDAAYAAGSRFGAPVVHGVLLFSALCAVMERALPDASLQRQSLVFPAPTFTGREMRIGLRVTAADAAGCTVAATITDPEGIATCTGEAVLEWGRR